MENTCELRVVFVTTDTFENAQNIGKIVVSERLAACCTLIQNCISIFSWQDTIQESHEYVLMIKTKDTKLNELEKRIIELHNYDLPEIIAVPADYSFGPYLEWVKNCLKD